MESGKKEKVIKEVLKLPISKTQSPLYSLIISSSVMSWRQSFSAFHYAFLRKHLKLPNIDAEANVDIHI
jgi:hypothetical protein